MAIYWARTERGLQLRRPSSVRNSQFIAVVGLLLGPLYTNEQLILVTQLDLIEDAKKSAIIQQNRSVDS